MLPKYTVHSQSELVEMQCVAQQSALGHKQVFQSWLMMPISWNYYSHTADNYAENYAENYAANYAAYGMAVGVHFLE